MSRLYHGWVTGEKPPGEKLGQVSFGLRGANVRGAFHLEPMDGMEKGIRGPTYLQIFENYWINIYLRIYKHLSDCIEIKWGYIIMDYL